MPKSLGEIDALTKRGAAVTVLPCEVVDLGEALRTHISAVNRARTTVDDGSGPVSGVGSKDGPACLVRAAMQHSLAMPGKLVRGHLLLLTVASWGRDWRQGLELARAVEVVHAASLIVDDLPAMDDATLRRGVTATHRAFGEATAILASIALIAEAFEAIAGARIAAEARSAAGLALARAIGPDGMAGGQQRDVAGAARTSDEVSLVHNMKTGALFAAAAEMGSVAAGIDGPRRWLMSDFGMLLGKAFQELDDLIDEFGTIQGSGKDVGQDKGKVTFVSLMGGRAAEQHALGQVALALECLAASGAEAPHLEAFVLSLIAKMRARYRIPGDISCGQREQG